MYMKLIYIISTILILSIGFNGYIFGSKAVSDLKTHSFNAGVEYALSTTTRTEMAKVGVNQALLTIVDFIDRIGEVTINMSDRSLILVPKQ